jgi:hypothetical protein
MIHLGHGRIPRPKDTSACIARTPDGDLEMFGLALDDGPV